MQIDRARENDIPQLLELYKGLTGPDFQNDPHIATETLRKMRQNPAYAVFTAREGDEIFGTAMGILCDALVNNGKGFLVIEDVVVAEKARGRGVGRLLLEALDALALEHNCAYAILVSSGFREGAHAFYERLGFTEDVRGFRKWYVEG